jgi:hypothetical protein
MIPLANLNRRHKAGLFVVLVATGLSLFFEASAKQTAGVALKWMRPEQGDVFDQATAEFPGSMSQEEIVNAFRTKILLPKPSFSLVAAIVTHRTTVVCGVLLVALGLFGFAGVPWWARKAERVLDEGATHSA